jgi:hypothetical protein
MKSNVRSRKSTRSLTPLFANPMAATLESPYLAPYTVPLDLRYAFCRYNLIENYCHPIKRSFCLQGNPSLLIMDFIGETENRRENDVIQD